MRKRSLSCDALGPFLPLDKEASEYDHSSHKSPLDETTDPAAKVSVVGTLPACYKTFDRKRHDVSVRTILALWVRMSFFCITLNSETSISAHKVLLEGDGSLDYDDLSSSGRLVSFSHNNAVMGMFNAFHLVEQFMVLYISNSF
ncbi:hypothetical protein FBUS_10256 [Fasciolopsis buskii]|uniref:Uncharacterized protein n=1 Tax=Fasciolopsis buskii TaxID=27845 RepID=A0A8E0RWD7_9TREM|nr:hypothetical protein FBUS_10256 [Fasciolopsis buski]